MKMMRSERCGRGWRLSRLYANRFLLPAWGEGQGEGAVRTTGRSPLQVRIGIHTGLVVIGEIGSSVKREILALGETPNLAARIQGMANPDEVMISAATYRLVEGLFACEDRGQPELKGVAAPLTLYRVLKEGEAQSRFEVALRGGLTPLVGRGEELAVLLNHWEQVKEGQGQVVLLSGEAGIGKSRLVQELKERVTREGGTGSSSAAHPTISTRLFIQCWNICNGSCSCAAKTRRRRSSPSWSGCYNGITSQCRRSCRSLPHCFHSPIPTAIPRWP